MAIRKGIDIANYQHPGGAPINFAKVRAAGYDWCAIKVSESVDYVNDWAVDDCVDAMRAGIEVVPYHFARPHLSNAVAEADWFESHIPMIAQSCKRMLDLEDGRYLGWGWLAAWVQGFISHKRCEFLYVNGYYLDGLRSTNKPLLTQVVLADPSSRYPHTGLAAVQTGQGRVDGIASLVDLDDVYYPFPANQ